MNHQEKMHVLSRAIIVSQEKLLLCKTLDLEKQFYYLPGGHIEQNESAIQALKRELKEETGFDSTIKRFLGCLEYSFDPGGNSICHNHEYNLFFEVESDFLKSHKKLISPEAKIGLTWISLGALKQIDLRPEPLKALIPRWLNEHLHKAFESEMI